MGRGPLSLIRAGKCEMYEDENVKMGCELVFTEYLLDLFSLPRLRGMTLFVPAAFFTWPFAKKQ